MGRGGKNDQIDIETRRAKALELRKGGSSYRAIAKKLGVELSTAYNDVNEALKTVINLNTANAEELRTIELERLDAMLLAISTQLKNGHLGAIDRALRIMERRAKLLGLDMPVQMQVNMTIEDKIIAGIRNNEVNYEQVLYAVDNNAVLAAELFQRAGKEVPVNRG